MRLNEFTNKVEFKIQDFGEAGFRIHVLSDIKINKNALPDNYLEKVFKYDNQVGILDIGLDLDHYPNVENVFLASEVRRQGLGKMLYSKALDHAKIHFNAKGISSDPSGRNENSDAFWDKFSQGTSFSGFDIRRDPFEGLEEEAAGVGIITKQNTTPDVKQGETGRQANKFKLDVNSSGTPKTLKP